MPLPFYTWKRTLLESAGSASSPVVGMGDFVLELFWRDGCEPTLSALLDYAQSGLHPVYEASSSPRLKLRRMQPPEDAGES
jgi:hypothetical protein